MYNYSLKLSDEMAATLDEKISICTGLGINNMELEDGQAGDSISGLTGEKLVHFRNRLILGNKKIVLLSCKEPVSNDDYYKKLFRTAHALGVENIRLEPQLLAGFDGAVPENIKRICAEGKSYGIGIMLENDSGSCLSSDSSLTAVYNKMKSENTGIIFNPLEYARTRTHPFFHAFYNSKLKSHVRFLRVNDGLFSDGSPTLPCEGNAEVKEMASILLARSFKGYFSYTPYMGNSDITSLKAVIDRFGKILTEI